MLNPHEKFVIVSISREDIADMMNDRIQTKRFNVPKFSADDDRLTSQVCGNIATSFADIYSDDLSEEDRADEERDIIDGILHHHFALVS